MVRVRPLNEREKQQNSKFCVEYDIQDNKKIILDSKPDSKVFNFDYIANEKTSQQEIFNIIGKPFSIACLEGYNACIFAYGQTGAGKTYTMQGNNDDEMHKGLQQRVFDYLFAVMGQLQKESLDQQDFLVKCNYLEIYNEQIMDLLCPTGSTLHVREDIKKGVYIEGLAESIASNSDEIQSLLKLGARNRHVGSTAMNFESSRSHSVFSMSIERKRRQRGIEVVSSSRFHFVDLAGSERQTTAETTGERLKEASNINKSLTVLGCVINSLVEQAQGKQRHIPYRDSKLTFILKDSLGGNSKTCIIAAISGARTSFQETLSTLKFAQRAKLIVNKAQINEDSNGGCEQLKIEIKRLKEELCIANGLIQHYQNANKDGQQINSTNQKGELTQQQHRQMEEKYNQIKSQLILKEQILEQVNSKSILQEEKCAETIQKLKEQIIALEAQLEKKEVIIKELQSSIEAYRINEVNYQMIMKLQSAQRQRLTLNNAITGEGHKESSMLIEGPIKNGFFNNEENNLLLENDNLLQLLQQQESIAEIAKENIWLKETLELDELNPVSTVSITKDLQENIKFMEQLQSLILDSMQQRKDFIETIALNSHHGQQLINLESDPNFSSQFSNINTNEAVQIMLKQKNLNLQEKMQQEYYQENLMKLQQEQLILKNENLNLHIQLENQRNPLKQEANSIVQQQQSTISRINDKHVQQQMLLKRSPAIKRIENINYSSNQKQHLIENQINELLAKIEEEQLQQSSSNHASYQNSSNKKGTTTITLDQENDEENLLQMLDNDAFDISGDQVENQMNQSCSQQDNEVTPPPLIRIKILEGQLECQIQKCEELIREKTSLELTLVSFEAEIKSMAQELEVTSQRIVDLNKELRQMEESHGQSEADYQVQHKILEHRINELISEKTSEFASLDAQIDKYKSQLDSCEYQKKKAQEDLETATSTLRFTDVELEEKNKELKILREQTQDQKQQIQTLQQQYFFLWCYIIFIQFYQRINQNLSQSNVTQQCKENHELRLAIEDMAKQNQTLRNLMREKDIRIAELEVLETNFKLTFIDLKNEIQKQFEIVRNLKDVIQEKDNELQRKSIELDTKHALTEILQKDVDELKNVVVKVRQERTTAELSTRVTQEKLNAVQESFAKLVQEHQKQVNNYFESQNRLNKVLKEQEEYKKNEDAIKSGVQRVAAMYSQGQHEIGQIRILLEAKISELDTNQKALQQANEQLQQAQIYRKHFKQMKKRYLKDQKCIMACSDYLRESNLDRDDYETRIEDLIEYTQTLERCAISQSEQMNKDIPKVKRAEDVFIQYRDLKKEFTEKVQNYDQLVQMQATTIGQLRVRVSELESAMLERDKKVAQLTLEKYKSAVEAEKNAEIDRLQRMIAEIKENERFNVQDKEKQIAYYQSCILRYDGHIQIIKESTQKLNIISQLLGRGTNEQDMKERALVSQSIQQIQQNLKKIDLDNYQAESAKEGKNIYQKILSSIKSRLQKSKISTISLEEGFQSDKAATNSTNEDLSECKLIDLICLTIERENQKQYRYLQEIQNKDYENSKLAKQISKTSQTKTPTQLTTQTPDGKQSIAKENFYPDSQINQQIVQNNIVTTQSHNNIVSDNNNSNNNISSIAKTESQVTEKETPKRIIQIENYIQQNFICTIPIKKVKLNQNN